MTDDRRLTNHEITIALEGGAMLGPFRATWSTEIISDVRELTKDYDAFLQGGEQTRLRPTQVQFAAQDTSAPASRRRRAARTAPARACTIRSHPSAP